MDQKIKISLLLAALSMLVATVYVISQTPFVAGPGNITISVDATRSGNHLTMHYGVNENSDWVTFVSNPAIQELHRHVKSSYVRVWISSQWYKESTIPLQDNGEYDFTNLDVFVKTVLEVGAKPFLVFAHAPGTYGEGHGELPPESDEEFARYVQTVMERYRDRCSDSRYSWPRCDVNEWYVEVWNEPFPEVWWEDEIPRYVVLFNEVERAVHRVAPQANVGGLTGWFWLQNPDLDRLDRFLAYSNPDFISVHQYGNVLKEYADEKTKMEHVLFLLDTSMRDLRNYIDRAVPGNDIEIINSEYHSDYTASKMKTLDEPFSGAWLAAALIAQIESQVIDMELFYSATSLHEDGGFGLWSHSGNTWPVYEVKKNFARYHPTGAEMLSIGQDDRVAHIMTKSPEGMFVTIANKQGKDQEIVIITKNQFSTLAGLTHDKSYQANNNEVLLKLKPYEVASYQVN